MKTEKNWWKNCSKTLQRLLA